MSQTKLDLEGPEKRAQRAHDKWWFSGPASDIYSDNWLWTDRMGLNTHYWHEYCVLEWVAQEANPEWQPEVTVRHREHWESIRNKPFPLNRFETDRTKKIIWPEDTP